MKRHFLFRYQLHEGYVPFDAWIKLVLCSIWLMMIRFLRMGKRLVMYAKRILPIIICLFVFELIIIPIGISLGKYNFWTDGIWDLRTFILTSIIISLVVGILNMETNRHKELRKQYWVYEDFKHASERFISSLCDVVNLEIEESIYLSEKNFDVFYERIRMTKKEILPVIKNKVIEDKHFLFSSRQLPRTVAIKIYFKQYIQALETFNTALLTNDFVGTIEHALRQIDSIYIGMCAEQLLIEEQEDDYNDEHLIKFIDTISRTIYSAIADIRRPWRWDIAINNKMDEIINLYDKNKHYF